MTTNPAAAPSSATPSTAGGVSAVGDPRLAAAQAWMAQLGWLLPESARPASSDASFRRYFRIDTRGAGAKTELAQAMPASWSGPLPPSVILMDAPPDREPLAPFLAVADLFEQAGLAVPRRLACQPEQGYLLLEDLGGTDLLSQLQAQAEAQPDQAAALADPLYAQAWRALIQLQTWSRTQIQAQADSQSQALLPAYDHDRLMAEMQLFPDWYLSQHLGLSLSDAERQQLQQVFERLSHQLSGQLVVAVHRDFHSRNLMCLPQGGLGILDFQDAVLGPVSYDLVSLLRDAYIAWPEAQQIDWAVRYWQEARAAGLALPDDFSVFWEDFECMGLQRHLKVLGIFARLSIRDGKHRYLADLPRVLAATRKVCERYGRFAPILRLLNRAEQHQPQVGYTF